MSTGKQDESRAPGAGRRAVMEREHATPHVAAELWPSHISRQIYGTKA